MKNGEMIKKIRKDLDVTQKELVCENLSRTSICKIEKGIRSLTEENAIVLSKKMNDIKNEKKKDLKYTITPEMLLGIKIDDINLFMKELIECIKNNKDKNQLIDSFADFDMTLDGCTDKLADNLLTNILDELIVYRYIYTNEIKKYCSKLLKITRNPQKIVSTNLKMMVAHSVTNDDDAICLIGNTIDKELKFCDFDTIRKFYFNIALANFNKENYKETLDYIYKARKIKSNVCELQFLTLEANTFLKMKKYKKAEELYFNILDITNETNIKANTHSNLCENYIQQNNLYLAEVNIMEALKYINMVNDNYKFNILLNKLILDIELNKVVNSSIKELLNITFRLNSIKKQQRVIKLITDYFMTICKLEIVQGCILILKELNIEVPSKLIVHLIKISPNIEEILKVV